MVHHVENAMGPRPLDYWDLALVQAIGNGIPCIAIPAATTELSKIFVIRTHRTNLPQSFQLLELLRLLF